MSHLRLFGLFLLVFPALFFAQQIQLPNNPLKGQIVFEEKGCVECHAIGGFGGTQGPDLSRELYFGSVLELASTIWNHSPEMNRKFRQLRKDRPQFTDGEMLDLFGFLYYLRYLGEPGSLANGKKLLSTKGCLSCHSMGGQGGSIGPNLEKVQHYGSGLYVIQAMWNHGPKMQEQIKKSHRAFPSLSGRDINDITAYLRQEIAGSVEVRMSPGDPIKGQEVFQNKSCGKCHLVEGKARVIGPSLSRIELKKGVTEVASLMWNHGPVMMDRMKKESIDWPTFEGSEMADLIAYLYFLGFEDKPGDASKGGRVFRANGCGDCHAAGGGGKATDLSKLKRFESPIQMTTLMWNHSTEMEDLFIAKNKKWPRLSTGDLRDIYAYLSKISVK